MSDPDWGRHLSPSERAGVLLWIMAFIVFVFIPWITGAVIIVERILK